ncbi:Marine sediment metagenome DNA, contig: S01H1_S12690 (Fragment) OS=marine sediment metagenome GN=S01H1_43143 PE=4 SV=1 [Gemmata massiliana]|uniref:Marine sediment metagenome DNA, contig: S01H1_S12690 n=1 Tax=Gemmata massiliana TaxID=1210884 RepID=A0A6P2D1Y9_9BACT
MSRLFPPEVVLRATNLTTNALFYFPPGFLRHRWVVAGERSRRTAEDAAEATRALREMIEGGRLSKAVPLKDGDRIATRAIEQDGPIAYSESTTLSEVFAEDANRCLLLNTDETEQQTKRILRATAARAAVAERPDVARTVAIHHALQRMIPRADVVVPFAPEIADRYPSGRHESRRDFQHLLQLIRAVALLRFRQRERVALGAIVASLEDYDVAERLAREPLGATASGVTRGARELLRKLRERFVCSEFSTTEAKQIGGASPRTLEGCLHELNSAGAVEQTVPPKGRMPARWKLTAIDPTSGEGILPSAEEVGASLVSCERAHKP